MMLLSLALTVLKIAGVAALGYFLVLAYFHVRAMLRLRFYE